MSKFQFLVNPDSLGLTSCITSDKLDVMMYENLIDIMNLLRIAETRELNELASSGRICLNKFVTSRFGYKDHYKINNDWRLSLIRASENIYAFILEPTNTDSVKFRQEGLAKIAGGYLKDDIELAKWLQYPFFSKLFYLEEYAKVISNDNLIRAISEYKNNFNKKEYMDWALDNGWTIGHIHRMFRTYLQRHVAYRNSSM